MKQRQKKNSRSREKHSSGSDDEMFSDSPSVPLRPMRAAQYNRATMEAEVQPGDTMQALSLRFHVSVAELKRLNNIERDNEIFAHRTLKIPITPHSMLLETLPMVHTSSGSSTPNKSPTNMNTSDDPIMPLDLGEVNDKLLQAVQTNTTITPDLLMPNPESESVNDVIFNSTLTPQEKTVSEHTSHITDMSSPLIKTEPISIIKTLDINGSDWGLKWTHLLCAALCIGFICPIIYVLYIAEHWDERHNHTTTDHKLNSL